MESVWVADLKISPATAEKISQKHGVHEDEVRQAIVCVQGLPYVWHDHETRGRRAIIEAIVREKRVLIVLYPRPHDAYGDSWSLGSAYPIDP